MNSYGLYNKYCVALGTINAAVEAAKDEQLRLIRLVPDYHGYRPREDEAERFVTLARESDVVVEKLLQLAREVKDLDTAEGVKVREAYRQLDERETQEEQAAVLAHMQALEAEAKP